MAEDLSQSDSVAVVVLAAGAGKRLRSPVPKVMHHAAGRPLLHHVLAAAGALPELARTVVVVGKQAEPVGELARSINPEVLLVQQEEPLGTGDAVRRCGPALEGFDGCVITLAGDAPLVSAATLIEMVRAHREGVDPVTLLTARVADPRGYGRVLRDEDGSCVAVVEESDATPEQKAIDEVSSGVWCFQKKDLFDALERISNDNAQGEFYLPDAAALVARSHGSIATVSSEDPTEILGVNDRAQLAEATKVLRRRKLDELMAGGVGVEDPAATYVDVEVEVGEDTVLRPQTFLEGSTRIGAGCVIGPFARLVDSVVEDGAEITFSVVKGSRIGPGATVGPFASIRPGTHLAQGSKAGSFVEIKGSSVGEGSKIPHLSYVGDADIGAGVNLGAGTITANYDSESKVKSRTVIGDNAFTGSDTTLVAPVRIGRDAGTGAGSVVTKDVSEGEIVAGVPARPLRRRRR
ncbi:MAG: bifunctional UDP-N-acetylglucosamine diphosphorylase/glucosamine-1-phosphate N-acetyltransferase GlmU [Actinomycetota bacterium]